MAYDNTARASAARETRRRITDAAHSSFLERGYAGTTIRQVADAAGTSPETVYKRFGSKAGLLKAAYDIAMAGDDEDAPVAERPAALAVRNASDPRSAATAYGKFAASLTSRAGELMRLALTARGSDADLDAFATTVDEERLVGATRATAAWAARGWLRLGLDADRARDQLWTFNSPSVWMLLTERGWNDDAYAGWLADMLLATILDEG